MARAQMADAADCVLGVCFQRERDEDMTPDEEDGLSKERIKAWHYDEWHYVGVWAEAKIILSGTVQTISTGGLWGIESDSDEAYFREVEEQEYDELRDMLAKIGFTIEPWSEVADGSRIAYQGLVHALPDRSNLYMTGRVMSAHARCGIHVNGPVSYDVPTCLECLLR